jgi:site-specific DNA recombinase
VSTFWGEDHCSPADIFTDDMMTSVSKYIALNIAREVKKGLLEKARNGWYPAHPPVGYKYTREGAVGKHGRKEARIIVDTQMKPIIYRIFELRAVEKKSYEAIGNIIRSEFKQSGDKLYKFNKSSVEKILLHPFYGGTFQWAGEEFDGKHELFIPPSWVQIVQGKMRGQPNKPMPVGSFSHFLKCAIPECGCQIIYDPKIKINRRAGTQREYHYYHCTDSKGVHKQLGLPQVNVAEAKIWSQLESTVQQISLTKAVAEDLAEKFHEREFEEAEKLRQQYLEHKERLESLLKKQDQLYDDFAKGLVDEDDYRRLKAKTKDEVQLLKAKLENDYRSTQELVRVRLKFTLELAKDMESNWKEATPSDRVVLLKNVSSNFLLDGLNVRYDLKKPFAVLSEIKLKGVSKKWCPGGDSNSQILTDIGF